MSDPTPPRTASKGRRPPSFFTLFFTYVVIALVVSSVAIVVVLDRQHRQHMMHTMERSLSQTAESLATALVEPLAVDDYARVDVTARRYVELAEVFRVQVFDTEGRAVAQLLETDDGVRAVYDPVQAARGSTEEVFASDLDGREVLSAIRDITFSGLSFGRVRVDMSLASTRAAAAVAARSVAITATIVTAASLVLLLLLIRRPSRDLARASVFARTLDFDAGQRMPTLRSSREVADLVTALNEASTRIADRNEELRASEAWAQKLAHVAARTSNGVVITGPDFKIQWINDGFERITGYTLDETVGKSPGSFLQGADSDPEVIRRIRSALSRTEPFAEQLVNYAKNGRRYVVHIEAQPVFSADGRLEQYIAIETDITERIEFQAKLAQERDFAVTIMNTVAQGITVVDEQWRFTYVNPAFAAIVGMSQDDLIGMTPLDVSEPLDPETLKRVQSDRVEGMSSSYEMRLKRAGGGRADVLVAGVPRFEDGRFAGSISVVTDITDRKRQESRLRLARDEAEAARQQAEEANEAKSEFLSRMSHELRTPLNAIVGFAELMAMDDIPTDQRDSLDRIIDASRHLLGLINEILDLSGIESGRMSLATKPVSIAEQASVAVTLLEPQADEFGVTVDGGRHDPDLFALCDEQRLSQILLNLLSNAIKYSGAGSRVVITSEAVFDDVVRISVADDGPGVPAESIDRLWVPFDRLDAEKRSDAVEGSGIGLALVKRLVEAMDGRVGVQTAVGEGSRFWVELPRAATPASESPSSILASALTKEIDDDRAGLRVAYVEDNLNSLDLVRKTLERIHDVELFSAMHGGLGLDLIRSKRPDLVLMDLNLPGMDGESIIRALGEDPDTAGIPVVTISADATQERIETISAYPQVAAYLTKPIDVRALIEVVQRIRAGSSAATD